MARRVQRDMTIEEFEALEEAEERIALVQQVADEEGGPCLSMIPEPVKAESAETWEPV